MATIQNALVRGFGATPNGMPSGQDFYITAGGGGGGGGVEFQVFVDSGTTYTVEQVNTYVGFFSPDNGDKTVTLPASTGSLGIVIVSDLQGTANTYPISVVAQNAIPANALLAEDGTPLLAEDGSFLLSEGAGSTTIGSMFGPNIIGANFGSLTFLDTDRGWATISQVGAGNNVPSNALLSQDGTPLLAEDGSYLLAN